MEFNVNIFESIYMAKHQVELVTNEEIKEAIKKLKNDEAADYTGLSAEHLKLGEEELNENITDLINEIVTLAEVPPILKKWRYYPNSKKGKTCQVAT